jgi:DNA replication and repair protein RecF
MALRRLQLNAFRNLETDGLELDPRCNLVFGGNGSGKTNLLEAIHLVCSGKSFRTSKLNDCIAYDQDQFLVRGELGLYQAGIQRTRSETRIRVEGRDIQRVSELAGRTAVAVLNESGFDLLCGSPQYRRSFIDWIVFHVEHRFAEVWRGYNRVVRQKNELLKKGVRGEQLRLWNDQLIEYGVAVQAFRKNYIQRVNQRLESLPRADRFDGPIEIQYNPGWSHQDPVKALLTSMEKELKLKYSLQGAHRDRLVFLEGGKQVCGNHSRGQLRKTAMMCHLTAVELVSELGEKPLIVLLDDLEAELDNEAIDHLLSVLVSCNAQVFISNIRQRDYVSGFFKEYKMFHVEHGMIRALENT